MLTGNWNDRSRGARFHAFPTTGTTVRVHDFRMFVHDDVDFAEHTLRACIDAFPAGNAFFGIKLNMFRTRSVSAPFSYGMFRVCPGFSQVEKGFFSFRNGKTFMMVHYSLHT
jgi:hypothetical protein